MYKCIKNVNTNQGSFVVGDIVGDKLGAKYGQFELVKEQKLEEVKPKKDNKKKEQKVEILVETPQEVIVEVEDSEPAKKEGFFSKFSK